MYRLPSTDEMLAADKNSKYFCGIDLCQGYYQVLIKECDKAKLEKKPYFLSWMGYTLRLKMSMAMMTVLTDFVYSLDI